MFEHDGAGPRRDHGEREQRSVDRVPAQWHSAFISMLSLAERRAYWSAAAPAFAIASSRTWLAAPLTPMAAITLPPITIGTPPCSGAKSASAIIGVRSPLMISSKAAVGSGTALPYAPCRSIRWRRPGRFLRDARGRSGCHFVDDCDGAAFLMRFRLHRGRESDLFPASMVNTARSTVDESAPARVVSSAIRRPVANVVIVLIGSTRWSREATSREDEELDGTAPSGDTGECEDAVRPEDAHRLEGNLRGACSLVDLVDVAGTARAPPARSADVAALRNDGDRSHGTGSFPAPAARGALLRSGRVGSRIPSFNPSVAVALDGEHLARRASRRAL